MQTQPFLLSAEDAPIVFEILMDCVRDLTKRSNMREIYPEDQRQCYAERASKIYNIAKAISDHIINR